MHRIAIVSLVSLLAACSSAPKETYERRAWEQQQQRSQAVTRTLDQAPKWMTEPPNSANAVFATGSAASVDLSMADNKAKMVAYSKICMAAGGRVDQRSRMFIQDSESASFESSEMAIRTMCPGVDITGVETRDIKRINENGRYRTYVLVALPTGDANLLQQRKDRMRMQEQAARRSDAAFREIDAAKPQ